MASGSAVSRVAAPTAATAVATTALAVAVNYATGEHNSWWMWVAVAGLTAVMFGSSVWLYRRQAPMDPTAEGAVSHDPPADGVVLNDIQAKGVRIEGVEATGTGVQMSQARVRQNIDISNVKAGKQEPPGPS